MSQLQTCTTRDGVTYQVGGKIAIWHTRTFPIVKIEPYRGKYPQWFTYDVYFRVRTPKNAMDGDGLLGISV